ncbi:MAG: primase, primase protein [Candidatus Parcubacteria bacterium]|jgi:DNA primase
MNPKDQVKENLSIVDVVSTYIRLEKSGNQFRARCPFHNERTPSFYVSPERKSFHCFGCQAGGDIFSFVEKIENIPFIEALKILADRAGVSLKDSERNKEESRLISLLKDATEHFKKNLTISAEGREYLLSRGLHEDTIQNFHIGYAKNEWRDLFIYLSSKGYSPEEMIQAGVVIEAKDDTGRTKGFYDRFRGRIMFPIRNISGATVGYSGRILPSLATDSQGKYVNTPETPLYHKSKILFGYDTAKKMMNEKKEVIVVEGQMDLCMSYQAGVHNTVAVSGTAFTDDHIHMIKRFCDTVILSFDADTAGQAALLKTAKLCLLGGIDVNVVADIGTKDPADLIQENPDAWLKAVDNKKHIITFLTQRIIKEALDERTKSRKIVEVVLPFVRALTSPLDREHFIRLISEETGFKQETLFEELSRGTTQEEVVAQEETTTIVPLFEKVTKELIAFASLHKKTDNKEYQALAIDHTLYPEAIIEQEIFTLLQKQDSIPNIEQYFNDLMTTYKREEHRAELMRLQKKLKEEGADIESVMKQIYEHMKKLL